MDDAYKVSKIVNSYLVKILNNEFKLDIKRGCTEFDIAYPGYKDAKNLDKVKYKDDWKQLEVMIDQEIQNGSKKGKKFFSKSLNGVGLGDVLIINNWLDYAKIIGDESYLDISDDFFSSGYILNQIKNRDFKS